MDWYLRRAYDLRSYPNLTMLEVTEGQKALFWRLYRCCQLEKLEERTLAKSRATLTARILCVACTRLRTILFGCFAWARLAGNTVRGAGDCRTAVGDVRTLVTESPPRADPNAA